MQQACPVCRGTERTDVLSLHDMPVLINAQVRPTEAPDVPRGDIDLVVCCGCGHLYNRSFDEDLLDYDASYENTLHYSPKFRAFAEGLADRLIGDHSLIGSVVAELGSGPGHFLSLLCERGVAQGIGYDPSFDDERLGSPDHPHVTISTEPFPDDGSLSVQLAFSQHVLEHLSDPVVALAAQRAAVAGSGGTVYSEMPNGASMVEHGALWDLIYEHLSYFVPTSLELACRRAGLAVTAAGAEFGDQFLWCEAEATVAEPDARPDPASLDAAVAAARRFGVEAATRIEQARAELAEFVERGPVALWGAGSKGMTYLNLVADVADVSAVVDLNPRKDGWGVPGTTATIALPERLTEVRPAMVLVANPVYVPEIANSLRSLGLDADVRPLWS